MERFPGAIPSGGGTRNSDGTIEIRYEGERYARQYLRCDTITEAVKKQACQHLQSRLLKSRIAASVRRKLATVMTALSA